MNDPRNVYEIVGVLREVFESPTMISAIFCEGDGNRFRIDADLSATGVVSSPLRLLAATRRQMEGHSLFDAVKILVEQTQLRQRLASLPLEDFTYLEGELDTLLTLAAEAEARGDTWLNSLKECARIFSCNATAPLNRRRHPTDHCAKGERFRMAGCYHFLPWSRSDTAIAAISLHHKNSWIGRVPGGADQRRLS